MVYQLIGTLACFINEETEVERVGVASVMAGLVFELKGSALVAKPIFYPPHCAFYSEEVEPSEAGLFEALTSSMESIYTNII